MTHNASNLAGLTHVGSYRLVSSLEQRPCKVVYFGVHDDIGRTAAIKLFLTETLSEQAWEELGAAFRRGARAAQALSHPNVAILYDWGEQNGVLYYRAEEFLTGKSLQQIVKEQGRLALDQALGLYEPLCGALDFAHARRVVHGDLKPNNIFVLEDKAVKITDFGVPYLVATPAAKAHAQYADPHYLAPEQLLGQRADRRSDIFSLGVVLYQLVTGHLPFEGEEAADVSQKVIKEAPIPPRELEARIPPELSLVIGRALAKNPAERYQTCEDLWEDLANFQGWEGHTGTSRGVELEGPTPFSIPKPGIESGNEQASVMRLSGEAPHGPQMPVDQVPLESVTAQVSRSQVQVAAVDSLQPPMVSDADQVAVTPQAEQVEQTQASGMIPGEIAPLLRAEIRKYMEASTEEVLSGVAEQAQKKAEDIWSMADEAVKSIGVAAEEVMTQLQGARGEIEAGLGARAEEQQKRLAELRLAGEELERKAETLLEAFAGQLQNAAEGIAQKSTKEVAERFQQIAEERLEHTTQQLREQAEAAVQRLKGRRSLWTAAPTGDVAPFPLDAVFETCPMLRLPAEPPDSFFERNANRDAEQLACEERLARAYWQCAFRRIQEKYRYGMKLPPEPPDEFQIEEENTCNGNRGADSTARRRYWERLRHLWVQPTSWEIIYVLGKYSLRRS